MKLQVTPLKIAPLTCLTLLVACGGSGGGGSTPTTTDDSSLYTFTKANGRLVDTTVSHASGNESAISTISGATTFSNAYDNTISLSNYTVDNSVRTFSVNTSGVTSTTLATFSANANNQQVWVGGTTWAHSRYGFFTDKTPNSNGLGTQYLVRNMPFIRYQRYYSGVATSATYNQAGSKAVGTYVTQDTQTAIVTCNISVAFTATGGAQSTADFTLSACDSGITTTGYLRAAKSSHDVVSLASIGTFSSTSAGGVFTPTGATIFYGLGGPNSEEIVGTVHISGTTSVAGAARQTLVTFAFGAKK